MADIRIKDLATLESASLTGDVFVIDGTTGTRKLSAFSPSFGGNATVTGTLTVNSTSPSVFLGTVQANAFHVPGNGASRPANTDSYLAATATTSIPLYVSGFTGGGQSADILRVSLNSSSDWFAVKGNGQVTCLATTASTSASSGALVVGSGTSGGLGVADDIHLGGDLNLNSATGQILISGVGNSAGTKDIRLYRSDGGDWSTFGLSGSAYAGNLSGLGNNETYIYSSSSSALRVFIGTAATNRFDFTSSQFKINPTTASTTTSSGALVVSGGVGVAGSINTDGTLRFNANSSLPGTGSLGISSTYGLNFYASTGSSYDFTVFSAAGQSILLVPTGTRNVSFSGTLTTVGNITSGAAITTSAPVGGAGLWELGLYSSTAPSATGYVTIEIGGTVYKLLASNV